MTGTTGSEARYIHKECGGTMIWDLSGGFCVKCHAEGLDADDVEHQPEVPAVPEVITRDELAAVFREGFPFNSAASPQVAADQVFAHVARNREPTVSPPPVAAALDPEAEATRSHEGSRELPGVTSPSPASPGPVAAATEAAVASLAEPAERSTGIAMIRAERARQVAVEGYTPEHDARHDGTQLARAAACYALHAAGVRQLSAHPVGTAWPWPWPSADFKPGSGPLAALVKAGALIAAEIDRLIDNG